MPILANNNKRQASGKKSKQQPKQQQNQSTRAKSQRKTNTTVNLTTVVRTAPVSRSMRVAQRQGLKTRSLANGHCIVTNGTLVPIKIGATTTADTITSIDLNVTNATAFPQLANTAKGYDKAKWLKCRIGFKPALPTTGGGAAAMYFDTERTDAPPSTITEVMQNKGAKMCASWDNMDYWVPKAMLSGVNQWYSTVSGAVSTTSTQNTFTSPGKVHILVTPPPGLTVVANTTVLGYLHIEFSVELGFPSNPGDSTVPTRRSAALPRDVSFVTFPATMVHWYHQFRAGCSPEPSFDDFLRAVDSRGVLQVSALEKFDPDIESRSLLLSGLPQPKSLVIEVKSVAGGSLATPDSGEKVVDSCKAGFPGGLETPEDQALDYLYAVQELLRYGIPVTDLYEDYLNRSAVLRSKVNDFYEQIFEDDSSFDGLED